jgi:uncharacterized membrane protein YqhA
MVDLSDYPFTIYAPSKAAAGVLAALIGISTIAWIIQSIQAHFKPRRPIILILISHLTIFAELVLRGALSTETHNSRAAFTATTVLLAVGQRLIILANYDFLTHVGDPKSTFSRTIVIGSALTALGSAILMIPAGLLSYKTDTIDASFQLRQASMAIVLCLTLFFYPIWYASKTAQDMTKQAIVLLIISSITCVIVAVFLVITSVPYYYIGANEEELWFYIFQLTPIAIAQFTWTILHPKRSLKPTPHKQENMFSDT